ncbi:MAG: hypothetical protein Q7N87_02940 [Candidatus Uhrbacteria bacterium]|nr:hypothetical protein [Candidatus Uhrbacteria bacterium]
MKDRYNVQCMAGHVGLAPVGSELEARCQVREVEGFLDALCVSAEECSECQEDFRRRTRYPS